MVTYALHKFPKRQDGGVTGHEFGYRVLRELSQVAAFSVTILLHLSNLFVIYWETNIYLRNKLLKSPRLPEWCVAAKCCCVKPYEKANRNFVAVATVLHQLGKTKTSVLFEHPVKFSWQPNSQQKAKQWNLRSSFHCPCRHFIPPKHGRCRLGWSAMPRAASLKSGSDICFGCYSMLALWMHTFWKPKQEITALGLSCSFRYSWRRRN